MRSGAADAVPAPGDQWLGVGDGVASRFALVKRYGTGDDPYVRLIRKPVTATIRVAVGGGEIAAPGNFGFDEATGDIVFAPGAVPPIGQAVTAGYEFDVPVRFDTDRLEISLATSGRARSRRSRLSRCS